MQRFALLILVLLTACTTAQAPAPVMDENASLVLKPSSYGALPGWNEDRQDEALAAFRKSCARIMKKPPVAAFGPAETGSYAQWQKICTEAANTGDAQARAFFETWFVPYQATADNGAEEGLFTGYYEASLRGSRQNHGAYRYPLRARPGDLVTVDLGEFRPALKGQRIAGRVVEGKLKPYQDHRAIVSGQLPPEQDRPLVWVDNPVDGFFLQIQGSGIIDLDDGTVLRVGYDGQNGHAYYAVGRELVKRGELPRENVTMQSIRAWLAAHPEQADDLMFANPSYVFFKELSGEGPLGGEGVALTPGRSLAVDRDKIPYGVPVWLDAAAPQAEDPSLQRLMIAQDTGGAIRGPVRGDFFWGHGPEAEHRAGLMKSKGRMWLLLPKHPR